ncbi:MULTISPECIES: STAS domain-containing protein [Bacillus]|uniref:STAS domain-containing protein n=1 Tax=Bacillus TaxID=1386 RepID=UPI0002D74DF2|nr:MULTISPECIES: STAS domain-containing protein [Bacillus]
MCNKTVALQNFLIGHATEFALEWQNKQQIKTGSFYSPDAPPHIQEKIKEQLAEYFIHIANSLLQEEAVMKENISKLTSIRAAERIESNTTLDEVLKNQKYIRSITWQYVREFSHSGQYEVSIDDFYEWQTKLDLTTDYIFESFCNEYLKILFNRINEQTLLIKELSAPVITLNESIGLLPIIGNLDIERVQNLIESTLQKSVAAGINLLIIDLSGVVTIDTMVAHQLFQLVDSLRLVGINTVLTGLRPEVAQTSIQIGLNFSNIQTENSLQSFFKKLPKENALL